VQALIFDFDNHYYESEDALTRHQDRALGNRGARWADIGGRRLLPRDVFGEHVWVTPFWEDDVAAPIGEVRADRRLLGSDWPHAEGTAAPADFVSQALADLPEDAVRRIARDNALELLGVDVA
jgi:Amidohydrolase